MINLDDCIELGVLGKPHGIKGQLILKLHKLSFDDIQEMELVFILIDGLPVPFFIDEFSERPADSIIIQFDTIHSETEAKKYCDLPVYVEKKILKPGTLPHISLDNLQGYNVLDKKTGKIGILDSVLDTGANKLIRVLSGKKEILIPLQPRFILNIDNSKKEILVQCPEGLLDLYL